MILVDANLLLYARIGDFREHEAARCWLDEKLNGRVGVALPWPSLLAFVRIATNPRVFHEPMSMDRAWAQVRAWLDCRPAWIPTPTERHADVLQALMPTAARPDLVPDAHLAALAIQYGLVLCSTDRDFARFPGLRWEDPLAGNAG